MVNCLAIHQYELDSMHYVNQRNNCSDSLETLWPWSHTLLNDPHISMIVFSHPVKEFDINKWYGKKCWKVNASVFFRLENKADLSNKSQRNWGRYMLKLSERCGHQE